VKGKDPLEQPKVLARWLNFSGEMLIGTIMDLLKLTFNPVDSEKECNTDFRKNNCVESPSRTIRVSSAY